MSESSHSESAGGYDGQDKMGGNRGATRTRRAPAGRTDLATTRRYADGGMGASSAGSGTAGGDALAARDDMYELSAASSTSSWTTSDGLDSVDDLKYRKQGARSR